jgi:hypothetical protein
MPEYQVPQFIEREARIVGPLTFRQFLFMGGAGAVVFLLYFTLAGSNFLLFLLISIILVGGGGVFAFLRPGGRSFFETILNFFTFLFTSKVYLWKKKQVSPKFIQLGEKPKKIKMEEKAVPKIIEKSRLKDLSSQIETRIK